MSIGGRVNSDKSTLDVVVKCYKIAFDTIRQSPVFLNQYNIFDPINVPFKILTVSASTERYQFDDLLPGNYSIFAFEDVNGNGKVSLNAPLGWWGSDISTANLAVINLNASMTHFEANVTLKQSHLYPTSAKGRKGGVFKQVNGYNIMHLQGSLVDRGYDHGYLAAPQIIDWFRYYVLEVLMSPKQYLTTGRDFLLNVLSIDEEFKTEGNAVLQGMKDSGADLHIPELSRDFNLIDLFAINAYIELGAASCTQFVMWGKQTVDGNLIAARNMDGENDIRKITVSHLTLFAIEPTEPNRHRYVSIMWPGFLGTLTSFNEFGLYAMMNTGRCASGEQVSNAKPVSWSLRHVIDSLTSESASPEQTQLVLNKFASSGGGISTSGTVFVFAREYNNNNSPPAYIYEGDKYGGFMRTPNLVSPFFPTCIMASNHFLVYGVNPFDPLHNFGQQISFSSHYRYFTGQSSIEAWNRTSHAATSEDLINLLQRVASGSTEHSVIWTPHDLTFRIANADMSPNSAWDAPYRLWTSFHFNDLFSILI